MDPSFAGRQIGRYRILERLGSGGMSVVYKGLDTTLEREVAIKVLHPHLAGKEESRMRLAREARAVAKLHHPNILEVFDFSDETVASDGAQEAYLVTEYIRGRTLRETVETRPIGLPEIGVMIIHTLATALAQAHDAGVIHRDLKPDNVMVREDGVLKLMDFGIAKLLDREERMTMTGALVGSPAHMAPEIIEGLDANAASDVFSLGTILYSLATGALPFTASNATATLKKILDGVYTDPRQLRPSVSDGLAEIIGHALARDPSQRYADAVQLRDALTAYLTELGIDRIPEELAQYFAHPEATEKRLTARLVTGLLARGEKLLADGKQARAMAAINHVLALEESQPRALTLLAQMTAASSKQKRRKTLVRVASIGGAALLLIAGTSWLSLRLDFTWAATEESGPALAPFAPEPAAAKAPLKFRQMDVKAPESLIRRSAAIELPPRALERSPVQRLRPVPITLLVRPYGSVRLDDEPGTSSMLARHALEATPGKHTVRVSCDLCEELVETIDVVPGAKNVFHLPVQPKPSRLTFQVDPPEAIVRVGAHERRADSTLERPIELQAPRGATSFQRAIEAEISAPGYVTEKQRLRVQAGGASVVSVRLRPLEGAATR